MSLLRTIQIENGNMYVDFNIYRCDRCGTEIPESYPHYANGEGFHLCWDCAFIEGYIMEKEYLECSGISLRNAHAAIHDEQVYIWIGSSIPPWVVYSKMASHNAGNAMKNSVKSR